MYSGKVPILTVDQPLFVIAKTITVNLARNLHVREDKSVVMMVGLHQDDLAQSSMCVCVSVFVPVCQQCV